LSIDRDVLHPDDPRPEVARALRAWLDLQQQLVFAPQAAREALAHRGDPAHALRCAGRTPGAAARLSEAAEALRRARCVAVPFGSRAYPERVAQLVDAPPLLLVRGEVAALAGPCVAMVGSRAASAYGRATARRFAGAFASAGLVVVSGLAIGIDGIAHAAALDAGGRSVAVQACGPDRVYPLRHRSLAHRIAESGALVTEFPPGTPPRPAHFPLRNRLISALARAVLVVEARERSGSLVTARHAADQGVDVYAVPGPVDSPTSSGTNRLLYDGAYPALGPDEVLEDLERRGVALERRSAAAQATPAAEPVPERRRILAALRDEPLTRDALARRLGSAPGRLALHLVELELAGAIVEDRDGRLRGVGSWKP
jgi:DNA processing protein